MTVSAHDRLPWFLVTASVALAALLAYTLFAGYLPAKRHAARLEQELRDLSARQVQLQRRLAQSEDRGALRDGQIASLRAERDALARRLAELERELAARRGERR